MISKFAMLLTHFCLILFSSFADLQANSYVDLSKSLVDGLRQEKDVAEIVEKYEALTQEELATGLTSRAEKLAFWINTYNGFVIYLLTEDPGRYENRGKFFTAKQIRIAGLDFSLDDIEHGVIRNSQVKWGFGYIRKWIIPAHISRLSIKKREPRIHFALNCGAKSCPPVAIYDEEAISGQLDKSTRNYLHQVSRVRGKTVTTTPLFSWFRGDFKGKKGIKQMLRDFDVVEINKDIKLNFGNYDWTLSVGNYIDW